MRQNTLTKLVISSAMVLMISTTSFAQYEGAEAPPEKWAKGFNSIKTEDSKALLSVLAGPSFAGRGTGQVGYIKAAHFVAGKLAEYGFEPIGDDGSYFQHFPMPRTVVSAEKSSVTVEEVEIKVGPEIGFTTYAGNKNISGEVVFINVKGKDSVLEEDLDLKEKIVILQSEDTSTRFDRAFFQKRVGALIKIVPGSAQSGPASRRAGRTVVMQISAKSASALAEKCGVDDVVTKTKSEDGVTVVTTKKDMKIELVTASNPMRIPNVVGWYEGSDPKLKHEHIVIGAHLDHLGKRTNGLYPGADDNGSGSTALLQIARAIHLNPVKPKRSILYIAFGAEELGLVGSRYYCKNAIKPLEDCICMLNIDMIGRNEESKTDKPEDNVRTIHLVQSKVGSMELHNHVLEANKHVKLEFEYDEERRVAGRSDQMSFANAGIPVTFLFGGFSPYYHQTTDNLEGINFEKIAAAAKLNYLCTMQAAEHGRYKMNSKEEAKAIREKARAGQ